MSFYPPIGPTPDGVSDGQWAAAVAAVRRYCGWHIAPSVTETLTLDGDGGRLLTLPTMHVTNVAGVTNDGAEVTDYEWSQIGLLRGPWWSCKFRGVTVTLTHGYDTEPAEVIDVMEQMARAAASRPAGVTNMTTGPLSVGYTSDLTAGAAAALGVGAAVLDRYRLPARP